MAALPPVPQHVPDMAERPGEIVDGLHATTLAGVFFVATLVFESGFLAKAFLAIGLTIFLGATFFGATFLGADFLRATFFVTIFLGAIFLGADF